MKEASKHGGLSVPVIKKVAKHVLMALKTIHDLKVVHSDIKLHNIAPRVSQLSLRLELEKIIEFMKSGKNISSLRMVCMKDKEIDVNKRRQFLEKELEEVAKLEIKDVTELIFKLIDFGNARKEGTESRTGTFGFRPPEYFFGSPLLPSHDIWSLGVSIVVLLTNKTFLEFENGIKPDEITALRNMFGKFSRHHFKLFKDPVCYKTKFSTRHYSRVNAVNRITKFLRSKLDKLQMDEKDRNELIGFLLQMLNTIPNERKSAAELLLNPWLNDISECDCNGKLDSTQKSSDSAKTQGEKETNPVVTPVYPDDTPSPSNNNGTSETPLGDQSNEKLVKIENVVISVPLTDPKHSKTGDEGTEKTKKATKKILRYDSFIYKENDGKYYLFHKYWKIPYRQDNELFVCPKCTKGIRFERKIGFVMVSKTAWHKNYRCPLNRPAPKKGYKYCKEWITKEEVDRKRKSLERQGFKPLSDPILPDEICPKEAEINDKYYETDSIESDEAVDSDSDETEEDSNKTISEFGSGESYYEDDESYAKYMESFSDN